MKSALTALVLIAFAGIAVFGFSAMGNHPMEGHGDCVAAVGQVALCPHEGPFTMAGLHAQFFQRMTSVASSLLLLFTLALWAYLGSLDVKRIGAVFKSRLRVIRYQFLEIAYALHLHSLFAWLSLRQRGDAVFA